MHPLTPFTSTNLAMTFHTVPSAAWFRGALQAIGRVYRFISAQDVEACFYGGKAFNGCCHICFDDGERSFLELAVPVLRSMQVPATLFVSPGVLAGGGNYWFQEIRFLRRKLGDAAVKQEIAALLGCPAEQIEPYSVNALLKSLRLDDIWRVIDGLKARHSLPTADPCNMTLDELVALSRDPLVAVGAHTMSHPILQNESGSDAEREIRRSVETLAALLNRPITYFAYPNGARGLDYGPREQAILRASGVTLAFTTDTGYFSRSNDPLAIPRAALEAGDSQARIQGKLWLAPVWDRLRRRDEARQRIELRKQLVKSKPPA